LFLSYPAVMNVMWHIKTAKQTKIVVDIVLQIVVFSQKV
jgi:hypothetical protein